MQTETIKLKDLKEGDTVYLCGHEMTVSDIRRETTASGIKTVRFTGRFTESERNRNVRYTAYDGGSYGGAEDFTIDRI